MARVRLYLDYLASTGPVVYRFTRPDGSSAAVDGLRLFAFLDLGQLIPDPVTAADTPSRRRLSTPART